MTETPPTPPPPRTNVKHCLREADVDERPSFQRSRSGRQPGGGSTSLPECCERWGGGTERGNRPGLLVPRRVAALRTMVQVGSHRDGGVLSLIHREVGTSFLVDIRYPPLSMRSDVRAHAVKVGPHLRAGHFGSANWHNYGLHAARNADISMPQQTDTPELLWTWRSHPTQWEIRRRFSKINGVVTELLTITAADGFVACLQPHQLVFSTRPPHATCPDRCRLPLVCASLFLSHRCCPGLIRGLVDVLFLAPPTGLLVSGPWTAPLLLTRPTRRRPRAQQWLPMVRPHRAALTGLRRLPSTGMTTLRGEVALAGVPLRRLPPRRRRGRPPRRPLTLLLPMVKAAVRVLPVPRSLPPSPPPPPQPPPPPPPPHRLCPSS